MSPALDDDVLTVKEICTALKISERTFYRWRELQKGPAAYRLLNGELRVFRTDFLAWLATFQERPA
jgi:predicted DNA-binding transcriptional regulator AlpA